MKMSIEPGSALLTKLDKSDVTLIEETLAEA